MPRISQCADYEGELTMIIGRRCHQLRDSDGVRPYALRYTCLNDVTARDLQKLDVQVAGESLRHVLHFRTVVRNSHRSGGRNRGNVRQWRAETIWTHLANDFSP
jgi:hypothetical protein